MKYYESMQFTRVMWSGHMMLDIGIIKDQFGMPSIASGQWKLLLDASLPSIFVSSHQASTTMSAFHIKCQQTATRCLLVCGVPSTTRGGTWFGIHPFEAPTNHFTDQKMIQKESRYLISRSNSWSTNSGKDRNDPGKQTKNCESGKNGSIVLGFSFLAMKPGQPETWSSISDKGSIYRIERGEYGIELPKRNMKIQK